MSITPKNTRFTAHNKVRLRLINIPTPPPYTLSSKTIWNLPILHNTLPLPTPDEPPRYIPSHPAAYLKSRSTQDVHLRSPEAYLNWRVLLSPSLPSPSLSRRCLSSPLRSHRSNLSFANHPGRPWRPRQTSSSSNSPNPWSSQGSVEPLVDACGIRCALFGSGGRNWRRDGCSRGSLLLLVARLQAHWRRGPRERWSFM